MAGRIDLFLVDALVGRTQIERNVDMEKTLSVSPKPVTVYPYHVAFSRRSRAKDMLSDVNRVIAAMKADGTVQRIVSGSR